jgi:glycosyltransferase involved in cell wall biosynthesis
MNAPMKVLVAHNAYQQRGGEDMVVEAEVALLRAHGHEVHQYGRHNDEVADIGRLALGAQTLWSARTTRELRALLAGWRPDIVHVHNSLPLISPSLHWACATAGVPVVQTLHNFRLACPQAMFLREGRVCESCLGRLPLPAVQHGCYRGSRAQSAVLAGMLVLHRGLGTWQHKVQAFVALNEFCRRKFIEAGLPAERLHVKPNFVEAAAPAEGPREGLLFGRLAEEKGVDTLAQALAENAQASRTTPLRVAGTGPLAAVLQAAPGVQMLGALPLAEVQQQMARARALVLPSIWYENFPRTLVEAFAAGLPVIASRIGALAELVVDGQTGLLFEPGDAAALADRMRWAAANGPEMARMGARAREVFEAHYTPEQNHRQLMAIYAAARAGPSRGSAVAPAA